MKKSFILIFSVSLLLFASCNKNNNPIPEGTYRTTENTLLKINGMQGLYTDYSETELTMENISGGTCSVTATNLVTGQPSVTMNATCEEQGASSVSINGTCESGDRTITLSAVVSGSSILELTLSENITSPVAGRWRLDSLAIAYQHPDMTSITVHITPEFAFTLDVQEQVIPLLNNLVNEEIKSDPDFATQYIEFTSDGFITDEGTTGDDKYDLMYFVEEEESMINLFIRKSQIADLSDDYNDFVTENPEIAGLFTMFGIGEIFENPSSLTIPFLYKMPAGSELHIYVDQTIAYPAIKEKEEVLNVLVKIIENITYEDFLAIAGDLGDFGQFINEGNFEEIKAILTKFIGTFLDGKAVYSITAELVPFNA